MNLTFVTALALATPLAATACKPDLGNPPSLVEGLRVLAVRGVPAEAPEGTPVTYDVLAVDVNGRIATPSTTWAVCNERKRPADSNAVSAACLSIPDDGGPAPTFMAPMPTGACKRFGPQPDVDADGIPVRPRDPDVTGGFFQPVRAKVATEAGAATAFAMERIKCRLSNAPSDVTSTFSKLPPNTNPVLSRVTLDPVGSPVDLFKAGEGPLAPIWVSLGSPFLLQVAWTPETPEVFPVWAAATETLEDHRESLSVAWYATGGTFDHDRTGRGEAEMELSTDNVWLAPTTPGLVHFWVVLRDSRGGLDFAEAAVEVGVPQ
jgi:hypothetical protein